MAAQRHLPSRLERVGEPRVPLGMAIVDWQARRDDDSIAGSGIARITEFWS